MSVERVSYDEFSFFGENAAEFGIAYDAAPVVRREFVEVGDGRSLSGLVWGDEPEVVLVHGGAQNAHTWDTVALALDRPLLALDLPGHGHSGPPANGPADVHRNAEDIAAVISTLAPNASMLVGMSLGGLTSSAVVNIHPDRFDALLLVDITPGVQREKAGHIAAFVNGPTSFESFDELLARTMEFNPTRSESSLRRGILHNAEQLDDGSWVWRHAKSRVFASSTDSSKPDRAGDARDYGALWDALVGHQGRLALARGLRPQSVVTDEEVAELLRLRPDARVENFAEAGHSIQGDMPIELAALISNMLEGA